MPDGRELLYAGVTVSGRAGVLDVATGQRRVEVNRNSNLVRAGGLSRDGKLAITGGGDRDEVFLWSTADGQVVQTLQGTGRSVWGIGWSRDGKTLVWGNTNGGSTVQAKTLIERSFRIQGLELGAGQPKGPFIRAQLKLQNV